jgi:translocation and assembly module TamA
MAARADEGLDPWREARDRPKPPPAYEVRISGVDRSLRRLMEDSSELIALQEELPETDAGLERRIAGDLERFDEILRSEGYHAATFDHGIRRDGHRTTVSIRVSPGPTYVLSAFEVELVGKSTENPPELPDPEALGLAMWRRAEAAEIVAAERRLLRSLARQGFPLARVMDRSVTVNHLARSVTVRLAVAPGPLARFGPVTFEGLGSVDEDYIRGLIPWDRGDPYDGDKLDLFKARLLRGGLFSAVVTENDGTLNAEGELPLTVTVVEAPPRSIGAGVKYSTADGFAGELTWEHRNVLGRNEDVKVTLEAGRITQQAKAAFRVPDFAEPGLDLITSARLIRVDSEAFDELGAKAVAGARLPIGGPWRAAADGSLEISRLRDRDGTRTSRLFGIPLSLKYDGTNSQWRPTEGGRLEFSMTPYAGEFDDTTTFLVNRVDGSVFAGFDDDKRFVLAGRASVGSIVGESRRDIPSNKRFYAGGDGSIRGYQYQRVGPLDDSRDPIGGRSLFLVGAEFRAIVWRSLGVVPFFEGGNVYEDQIPDFSREPRWAAGIGLRHHTLFGPVRLDFAFPINRRQEVDNRFEFYISIGQAF